jgi:Major Facilitator Superfamily
VVPGVLRERNFSILFAGRAVDAFGNAVAPAALTVAVVTATRSSAGLAVILVCGMLPRVALLPVAGVVVDRAGARRAALAADLVAGLAQLAIGLLLLAGHLAIAPIAVAAAAGGAASAFGVPAALPLVSGTVTPAARKAANSLLGAASSAASVAGPAAAGALIFTVGAGWAFVLDAVTFAVAAGTLAVIQVRPVPVLVPRQSLRAELAAGWAEVRARTWYWASIIGHGTANFALGLLLTAGPLIAVTELGGKTVWLAALEASAAGYLAGALVAGRVRISRGVLAVDLVLTSLAAPLVLFGLAAPAWLAVVSYGLAAIGLGFANPVWLTAVQQEVPAAVLARVSAYDWLVSLGGQLLGFAAGPALTRAAGFAWPMSATAVLVVITLVVPAALPAVRGLRLSHA